MKTGIMKLPNTWTNLAFMIPWLTISAIALGQGTPLNDTTGQDLSGTWRLTQNQKLLDKRLDAIEVAIGNMGRFQKGHARKLLAKKTAPPSRLTITDHGSEVKLQESDFEALIPTNGQAVTVKTEEGVVTIQSVRRDGRLIIWSKTPKATVTKAFSISADGKTLTQSVHIQGKQLQVPIQFTNHFERQPFQFI